MLSPLSKITLPSFAKINWTLRVLGRRPQDGYHEIRTLLQTVTLHDLLTFELVEGSEITVTANRADVPDGAENLAYKAAHFLRDKYAVDYGARISIDKRIPAGGGLGGGSSNAAVTLLALSRLWNLHATFDDLSEIGARLGADVPFFLIGGTAFGEGTGTILRQVKDVVAEHLLIVTPPVHVSTARAYKSLNARVLTNENAEVILPVCDKTVEFSPFSSNALVNDFERAVFQLYPETGVAKKRLGEVKARGALLSGSGASVFAIFDNEADRDAAEVALRAEDRFQVFSCSTIARETYRERLKEAANFLSDK